MRTENQVNSMDFIKRYLTPINVLLALLVVLQVIVKREYRDYLYDVFLLVLIPLYAMKLIKTYKEDKSQFEASILRMAIVGLCMGVAYFMI